MNNKDVDDLMSFEKRFSKLLRDREQFAKDTLPVEKKLTEEIQKQQKGLSDVKDLLKVQYDKVSELVKIRLNIKNGDIASLNVLENQYLKQMDILNASKSTLTSYSERMKLDKELLRLENLRKITGFARLGDDQTALRLLKDTHSEIKDRTIQLEKESKLYSNTINKLENQKSAVKELKNSFGDVGAKVLGIYETLMVIASNPLMLFVTLIAMAYKRWSELDQAAAEFRKTTGFTIEQTKKLEESARRISQQYTYLGVQAKDVYESAKALSDEFNGMLPFVNKNVEFVTLMSKSLGVASVDSAKVLKMFMGISGQTSESAKDTILFASGLSKAAGVPLPLVMKDVANASEQSMIFVGKTASNLIKATVEARRLGTTLDSISNSMSSVLDFQASMNKEMELSTLAGRHISLNGLRNAAYSKDANAYMKEMAKVMTQIGDITKMNPFLQKSYAAALGMSVKELINMQSQEKALNELRQSGSAEDKLLLQQYEEMQKIKDKDIPKAADRIRNQIRENQLQSKQEELLNNLNQLWVEISDVLYPIINVLMMILVPTLKVISYIVRSMVPNFNSWSDGIMTVIKYSLLLTAIVKGFFGTIILGWLKSSVAASAHFAMITAKWTLNAAMSVYNFSMMIAGWAKTGIAAAASWIPSILGAIKTAALASWTFTIMIAGWVSTGIAAASAWIAATGGLILLVPLVIGLFYLLIKNWDKVKTAATQTIDFISDYIKLLIKPFVLVYDFVTGMFSSENIGQHILNGITSISKSVFDVLVFPWKSAWNWISNLFVGKSPSKLGLGIVRGLKSVASSIIETLLKPFKFVFDSIKSLMSGVGDLFKGLLELGKAASDLWSAAGAIASIGVSMGVLSTIGVGSKLASWLPGKGQFDGLLELASMAPELNMIGTSIQLIAEAGDLAAESIDKIAESVDNLKSSLNDLSEIKLAMLTGLTLAGKIGSNESVNTPTDNSVLEGKLDELITLFKSDGIAVYLDGTKVSQTLAYNT